jgi:serine/threonine protein kinase
MHHTTHIFRAVDSTASSLSGHKAGEMFGTMPLQTVHSCGLAHCDVKPENIMLMPDGAIKLCDFGAAVAIDPRTGRVAAMPAEINNLELQVSFSMSEDSDSHVPEEAELTPYSLRKVTQVCSHVN